MKGEENGAFQSGEKYKEANERKDDVEVKAPFYLNEVSVNVENYKLKHKNKINLNKDFFTTLIIQIRFFLGQLFFGDNTISYIFWIVLINGVAGAVLVTSVIHYIAQDSAVINYCEDVGFLWILYGLVYGFYFYYLTKSYFKKIFKKPASIFLKCYSLVTSFKYFRVFLYLLPILTVAIYVIIYPGKTGRRIYSFLGLIVFLIFGFIFSKHPDHVNWRPIISGIVLQFLFGLFAISLDFGKELLSCLGNKITVFLSYADEGAEFVYGFLTKPQPDSGPVFAFTVLPTIFFLNFFINILNYYGALQWIIMKISWIVKIFMGTTVCESVNAAASIFFGMTEAPLLVQSYLKDLTKSEICAIMCAGWSTVSGSVMAAYLHFGIKPSHLIAASIMSAPAALSLSKLFYPETENSKTRIDNIVLQKERASNVLDAASKGATAAISLIAGVIANIIAFLAFISFLDGTLTWIGFIIGFEELSFKYLTSKIFIPISFLMGVEMESLEDVAYLVGIKTVANEFQAFQMLGEIVKQGNISERSEIIATYALCGFSNFGSVGITIGALSTIEPSQRSNITEVALQAFITANITCFMTACVAGQLLCSYIFTVCFLLMMPVADETETCKQIRCLIQ